MTLYTDILAPSLNERFCEDRSREICIWEEHVRTSIVRSVIECCYPYVTKERTDRYGSPPKGRAIVACPTEEYHEIGARMVADFLTLCGYDAVFVGANTPQDDILQAIGEIRPAVVAISVTTCYNLVAAGRTLRRIRRIRDETAQDFKIIVGGYAFQQNPDTYRDMGADLFLNTFEDIRGM